MKCEVTSLESKKVGDIDLSDDVFGVTVRRDILARMVNWQLAKRRAGTHKTKGISDIRGTTRKPWKQKGTGHARQGSLRSPQFRGGAVIFGPVVRSHEHGLTKKVRRLALKTALSAKQADGKLVVVDALKSADGKTRTIADQFAKLGWGTALLIDGPEVDTNLQQAIANLPGIDLLPQQGVNVYDILRHDTLVLSRAAVEHLESRLK
ncbi:MAG: 50S ribosomal protein L4 [Dongiaceae bacterium]